MHYAFSSRTDTGRARANNEDALLIDEAHALAILADGMGGYNAGEVAAGMAVYGLAAQLFGAMDLRELKTLLRRPGRTPPVEPAGGADLT